MVEVDNDISPSVAVLAVVARCSIHLGSDNLRTSEVVGKK